MGITLTWQGSSGISLNTDAEASLGLYAVTDRLLGSLLSVPALSSMPCLGNWGFDVGIRMALMSRTKINGLDFGTALQFISHLGLSWRMGEHFEVGYQYQHMSNGGMNNSNPGLNMHVLRFELLLLTGAFGRNNFSRGIIDD
ncbi:MAG: acyloxyacyl hydrolase [Gammaproteobacteria bacterium]|nr:acyloxyacyl hydrolase [Gammaproteobacteria bacterium]